MDLVLVACVPRYATTIPIMVVAGKRVARIGGYQHDTTVRRPFRGVTSPPIRCPVFSSINYPCPVRSSTGCSALKQVWRMSVNVCPIRFSYIVIPRIIPALPSETRNLNKHAILSKSHAVLRLRSIIRVVMCDKCAATYPADISRKRPVEIVIVKFPSSFTSITANLGAVASDSHVVTMIVPEDPAPALPSVNGSGKLVAARVVNAVVLRKQELFASEIGWLCPRHIAPEFWAGNSEEYRLRAVVRATRIKDVVVNYTVDGSPCRDIVVLKRQVVEMTVIDSHCM